MRRTQTQTSFRQHKEMHTLTPRSLKPNASKQKETQPQTLRKSTLSPTLRRINLPFQLPRTLRSPRTTQTISAHIPISPRT